MEDKQKKRGRLILTIVLAALAAACGALWLYRSGVLDTVRSVEDLRAQISRAGPYAGAAYFVIQLLSVIIAPIPSNVSMMAGALALGFWDAMLLGVTAIWLGSMAVFLAARRLGQRAVQNWIDHSVMEKYLPVIKEKQDMFLFLTLLFPFFPDDTLCILAGLTTIPTGRFALLVLFARPWGLVFAALLGSGRLSLPAWGWALLLAVLTAIFVLAMKYSQQIEEKLLAFTHRLTHKR